MRVVWLLLMLLGQDVRAGVQNALVARVELSEASGVEKSHLIYFRDGRVGWLSPAKSLWLLWLLESQWTQTRLHVKFDSDANITFVRQESVENDKSNQQPLFEEPKPEPIPELEINPQHPYEPAILEIGEAHKIFHEMNPHFRGRSQCYNRAHIWTYEAYQKRKTNLMKVFMFFTSKYIWEYRYHWWFHVSPFSYVRENDQVVERVLDYAFMEAPVGMREWSNHFILPKKECPTVLNYSDYDQHQWENYCYFMKVPMFFWQPRDLEAVEQGQAPKTQFIEEEVRYAYRQGFW